MTKREQNSITSVEIASQPVIWKELLLDLGDLSLKALPSAKSFDRVIFTGCGSTYYLAIWAARLFVENGYPLTIALPASELCYASQNWIDANKETLLVAVSRSGSTSETLQAIENFRKFGTGATLGVVCEPNSKLAEASDVLINTQQGTEKGIIVTRSFTAMMLGILWWLENGVPSTLPNALADQSLKLMERYEEPIKNAAHNPDLDRFYYLGNSRMYGLALQMMLTQQEMAHDKAESYHFMEYRHGPRTFAGPSTMLLGISHPLSRQWEAELFADMNDLGVTTMLSGSEGKADVAEFTLDLGKNIPEPWRDLLHVLLLQLFSQERALHKGINPDAPSNLTAYVQLN